MSVNCSTSTKHCRVSRLARNSPSLERTGPSLHTSSKGETMVIMLPDSTGHLHPTLPTCPNIVGFEEFLPFVRYRSFGKKTTRAAKSTFFVDTKVAVIAEHWAALLEMCWFVQMFGASAGNNAHCAWFSPPAILGTPYGLQPFTIDHTLRQRLLEGRKLCLQCSRSTELLFVQGALTTSKRSFCRHAEIGTL